MKSQGVQYKSELKPKLNLLIDYGDIKNIIDYYSEEEQIIINNVKGPKNSNIKQIVTFKCKNHRKKGPTKDCPFVIEFHQLSMDKDLVKGNKPYKYVLKNYINIHDKNCVNRQGDLPQTLSQDAYLQKKYLEFVECLNQKVCQQIIQKHKPDKRVQRQEITQTIIKQLSDATYFNTILSQSSNKVINKFKNNYYNFYGKYSPQTKKPILKKVDKRKILQEKSQEDEELYKFREDEEFQPQMGRTFAGYDQAARKQNEFLKKKQEKYEKKERKKKEKQQKEQQQKEKHYDQKEDQLYKEYQEQFSIVQEQKTEKKDCLKKQMKIIEEQEQEQSEVKGKRKAYFAKNQDQVKKSSSSSSDDLFPLRKYNLRNKKQYR